MKILHVLNLLILISGMFAYYMITNDIDNPIKYLINIALGYNIGYNIAFLCAGKIGLMKQWN